MEKIRKMVEWGEYNDHSLTPRAGKFAPGDKIFFDASNSYVPLPWASSNKEGSNEKFEFAVGDEVEWDTRSGRSTFSGTITAIYNVGKETRVVTKNTWGSVTWTRNKMKLANFRKKEKEEKEVMSKCEFKPGDEVFWDIPGDVTVFAKIDSIWHDDGEWVIKTGEVQWDTQQEREEWNFRKVEKEMSKEETEEEILANCGFEVGDRVAWTAVCLDNEVYYSTISSIVVSNGEIIVLTGDPSSAIAEYRWGRESRERYNFRRVTDDEFAVGDEVEWDASRGSHVYIGEILKITVEGKETIIKTTCEHIIEEWDSVKREKLNFRKAGMGELKQEKESRHDGASFTEEVPDSLDDVRYAISADDARRAVADGTKQLLAPVGVRVLDVCLEEAPNEEIVKVMPIYTYTIKFELPDGTTYEIPPPDSKFWEFVGSDDIDSWKTPDIVIGFDRCTYKPTPDWCVVHFTHSFIAVSHFNGMLYLYDIHSKLQMEGAKLISTRRYRAYGLLEDPPKERYGLAGSLLL